MAVRSLGNPRRRPGTSDATARSAPPSSSLQTPGVPLRSGPTDWCHRSEAPLRPRVDRGNSPRVRRRARHLRSGAPTAADAGAAPTGGDGATAGDGACRADDTGDGHHGIVDDRHDRSTDIDDHDVVIHDDARRGDGYDHVDLVFQLLDDGIVGSVSA